MSHFSRYEYDVPVTLGAHLIRLLPRDLNQIVRRADIIVDPSPTLVQETVDGAGNRVRMIQFGTPTRHLEVKALLEVEVLAPSLPSHRLPALPWSSAQSYLGEFFPATPDSSVVSYGQTLLAESGGDPFDFLDRLTQKLFSTFHRHIRPTGAARTPAETLALGSGACRDLTVLFVAVCQSVGLAARFVSGYQARSQTPDGERHLHAWAEVFLGDVGWLGFDPTHGERVSDGHLALYAGHGQASTMPIEGGYSFIGPEVNSTLTFSVRLETS